MTTNEANTEAMRALLFLEKHCSPVCGWLPDQHDKYATSIATLRASLSQSEARVAELENALARIVGMCSVPAVCTCGRPNGLPAVVACARSAIKGDKP